MSDPQRESVGPWNFDVAVIDGLNEYNVKNLEEGDGLTFFQRDEWVLIGQGHATEYVAYVSGGDGTLTMVSKGGFGSTGEIEVSGATDEALFKDAVRRFSKKKLTFV